MIRTESIDGRCTRASVLTGVSLQTSPADPTQGGAPTAAPAPLADRSLAGLRILVVEDDTDARELLSAVLTEAGAVVECASSVATGFDAFSRFKPNLLLSDIAMPEEDGYSLMRRVRSLCAAEGGRVPAIALSAFTRGEDRIKALEAGFSLHMGKPVFPAGLVQAAHTLASPRLNTSGTPRRLFRLPRRLAP
jgi:CheY-like chemotaxis protein